LNRHIAFLSFPHPPHVNPTLPIVSVLARRGFRVTYVTSDRFRARLIQTGADVITCQSFDPSADHHFNRQSEGSSRYQRVIDRTFKLADHMFELLLPIFENRRPAALIWDAGAIAGPLIANRLKIPQVSTTPMFAIDIARIATQVTHAGYREELMQMERLYRDGIESRGLDLTSYGSGSSPLTIQLIPKAIQPDGDVFGEGYFYAGRCAGEQPIFGTWQRTCECGRPLVLISSSTTALQRDEYYRMCIEALDGLGLHVVLSIGDHGKPESLPPLPPHFEIAQKTSHLTILRSAALIICMGGNVTTSEALYHGVPLIVMSCGHAELEWQADNLAEIGCGIHVKQVEMSAACLRSAAQKILSDSKVSSRVTRLKREVRREPGAEEVANRIEDYAHLS
jgi:MGT family glycosyltransferase